MAKKSIFLIRHGLTPGNKERRYIGLHTDEALSAEGRAQAEAIREQLASQLSGAPDRITASAMKRTVETATILFDGASVQKFAELREMDFGMFEGKTNEELRDDPRYRACIESGGTMEIPGGEKREDFFRRSFSGFLKALGEQDVEETVAVVCHGGTIMAVMQQLLGGDYYDYMVENLCGYRLVLETGDEGITVLSHHKLGPWHPA